MQLDPALAQVLSRETRWSAGVAGARAVERTDGEVAGGSVRWRLTGASYGERESNSTPIHVRIDMGLIVQRTQRIAFDSLTGHLTAAA